MFIIQPRIRSLIMLFLEGDFVCNIDVCNITLHLMQEYFFSLVLTPLIVKNNAKKVVVSLYRFVMIMMKSLHQTTLITMSMRCLQPSSTLWIWLVQRDLNELVQLETVPKKEFQLIVVW